MSTNIEIINSQKIKLHDNTKTFEHNIITSNVIGIVPLGGNASRMKHLPKFLLPCTIGKSLLDNIIDIYKNNNINTIIAGVSEINDIILKTNENLQKIIVNTKTMSETVYTILQTIESIYLYKSILLMPDTFIKIKDEISTMITMLDTYDIVVLLWNIKDYQIGNVGQCKVKHNILSDIIDKDSNCSYEYFWGSIGWKSNMNKYIDPNWETIGELLKYAIINNIPVGTIICNSDYYDCGTYKEYFTMIKNET